VLDYAFGDVWMRPQLSRRDRSMIVIAALTALNMPHELEIHLAGALNHGVSTSEIEEVMITAVPYGGFPRAIDGMLIAKKVISAAGAT
jgi:4-carboxymuconolactone decarboxylase